MEYFKNHLPKGEKIIARTRKSVWIFAREVFIAVVLIGIILGLQLGLKIEQKYMFIAYGIAAVILMAFLTSNLIKFASTMLVVTTHKFMVKEDLITIKVFDTQLNNVDGIEVEYRTPIRRALNVGNIKVCTRSSVHEYRNIAKPDKFTAILNHQCSSINDNRVNKVHVTFGIGVPKRPTANAEGKKIKA